MANEKYTEHYLGNGVVLAEVGQGEEAYFEVCCPEHYQVTFGSAEGGRINVSIWAKWSDDAPDFANYTPRYEYSNGDCAPGEVTITNEGLLTVMTQQLTASGVRILKGWTAQLSVAAVEPIRRAIALAQAASAAINALEHGAGKCSTCA